MEELEKNHVQDDLQEQPNPLTEKAFAQAILHGAPDGGEQSADENAEEQEPYTPRPLGFRIFALVLAVLVIIGVILYYYHIFIGR